MAPAVKMPDAGSVSVEKRPAVALPGINSPLVIKVPLTVTVLVPPAPGEAIVRVLDRFKVKVLFMVSDDAAVLALKVIDAAAASAATITS